jgi:hypothetical protein
LRWDNPIHRHLFGSTFTLFSKQIAHFSERRKKFPCDSGLLPRLLRPCSSWDTKPLAKWIHAWKLFPTGSIYYLQNGRMRGVLLWNVRGQVADARALIAERSPFHPRKP